ncbi:MAG: hypothetical protein GY925_04505 [Actinomycetia bacterium]|nr:hypothetical protein [Actinomycetes bacterium]
MDASDVVAIQGLTQFRKELNKVSKSLGKEMGQINKRFAEPIADDARSRARARGGSAAKTAKSIKATAQQAAVRVALGGPRYPFAWGAEFGAKQYLQFEPWTGNQWSPFDASGVGYFLHPAIRDRTSDIDDHYLDDLVKITETAFPD